MWLMEELRRRQAVSRRADASIESVGNVEALTGRLQRRRMER